MDSSTKVEVMTKDLSTPDLEAVNQLSLQAHKAALAAGQVAETDQAETTAPSEESND